MWKIDLGVIAIKGPALPIAAGRAERRRLEEEFDACRQARVPYAACSPVAGRPAA